MIRRIQQFTTQNIPVATVAGLEPKSPEPRMFPRRARPAAAVARAAAASAGKRVRRQALRPEAVVPRSEAVAPRVPAQGDRAAQPASTARAGRSPPARTRPGPRKSRFDRAPVGGASEPLRARCRRTGWQGRQQAAASAPGRLQPLSIRREPKARAASPSCRVSALAPHVDRQAEVGIGVAEPAARDRRGLRSGRAPRRRGSAWLPPSRLLVGSKGTQPAPGR